MLLFLAWSANSRMRASTESAAITDGTKTGHASALNKRQYIEVDKMTIAVAAHWAAVEKRNNLNRWSFIAAPDVM